MNCKIIKNYILCKTASVALLTTKFLPKADPSVECENDLYSAFEKLLLVKFSLQSDDSKLGFTSNKPTRLRRLQSIIFFFPQYPSSYLDTVNIGNIWSPIYQVLNVWSTILKKWNRCSILWYRIFSWFFLWLFSVKRHCSVDFNISSVKIFGFCLC